MIDPHGDMASECARQMDLSRDWRRCRKGKSSDMVYISPSLSSNRYPTLNPFDIRGKGYSTSQIEIMAQHLTSAFTAMLSKGDVRLSLNMRTLLTPMLFVLLHRSSRNENPSTFFDLERFLDDERNEDLFRSGIQVRHKGMRRFFEHLFHDQKFAPTKFSLRIKLASLLNTRWFTRLLSGQYSSWDLETLMNQGKTIIIDASKSTLGHDVSEIYGRMMTALIQSYTFIRKKRIPTFLVIDEAASFVSEDIKTILA